MICDLQKASIIKRLSAFLLDFILLSILAVGAIALFSIVVHYDARYEQYNAAYVECENLVKEKTEEYKQQHSITFDLLAVTQENASELTQEQRDQYDAYLDYINNDAQLKELSKKVSDGLLDVVGATLTIIPLGLFVAFLILEFIVPLCLKNGQTVGKKVFGIAVIHTNGVKISTFSLFVRGVLGKYTIETMVPVFLVLMFFLASGGLLLIIILAAILILQLVLLITTKTNSFIHDIISYTVEVDLSSQMIFSNEDDRLRYISENHNRQVSSTREQTRRSSNDDDETGEIR